MTKSPYFGPRRHDKIEVCQNRRTSVRAAMTKMIRELIPSRLGICQKPPYIAPVETVHQSVIAVFHSVIAVLQSAKIVLQSVKPYPTP